MTMMRRIDNTSGAKHSSQRTRERKRRGLRCFIVEVSKSDLEKLRRAGLLPTGEVERHQEDYAVQDAWRLVMDRL